MNLSLLRQLLPALLPLVLGACSSTSRISMVVPAPLTGTAPLEVERKQGFKHSYRFGDFATTSVRPGWLTTSTRSSNLRWLAPVWFDQTRARRKFSFTMQPATGEVWQVQGAYYAWSEDLTVTPNTRVTTGITLNQEDVYSSVIQGPGQTWQLLLESQSQLGDRPQFAQGTLSNGDSVLQVRPLSQLLRKDGRPMNLPFGVPVGYEFRRPNGSVVAAVELMGRGRVWLAPGLAPALQAPVAAAVTAMLMRD
ncbi:hypothetical protein [Hymenobacter sp. B81]|uniref:hypothetical protein n=1 Tax=Hymenobacter sp. B81 TaxID=3344878 RepID=UPI0037DC1A66